MSTITQPQPMRIQRSRQHKQVSPNGLEIVYCGRPGKWGNPFQVGNYYRISPIGWLTPVTPEAKQEAFANPAFTFISNKAQAAALYEKYINQLAMPPDFKELKGKNLSCWCKVGEPCHVDTILKIANK